MRSPVVEIGSKTEFEEAQRGAAMTIVRFHAHWSAHCRLMSRVVDALAPEFTESIAMYSVDVDQVPELPQKYGVSSLPALALFRVATLSQVVRGTKSERSLRKNLDGFVGGRWHRIYIERRCTKTFGPKTSQCETEMGSGTYIDIAYHCGRSINPKVIGEMRLSI